MSDDKPINRRKFFRAGFAEIFKPLSKAIRPLEAMAHEIGKLEDLAPPPPRSEPAPEIRRAQNTIPQGSAGDPPETQTEHWVRPPGARPEQEFLDTCSRCGECVRVCPVNAIRLDPRGEFAGGAPYIDVETQPCVMCENLDCLYRCPSGAILAVPREQIDIGIAQWIDYQCLNTMGSLCTTCVDRCPVGTSALELIDNRIEVHEDGCTGCGVCQHACPTYPKSIVVMPKSMRDEQLPEHSD